MSEIFEVDVFLAKENKRSGLMRRKYQMNCYLAVTPSQLIFYQKNLLNVIKVIQHIQIKEWGQAIGDEEALYIRTDQIIIV